MLALSKLRTSTSLTSKTILTSKPSDSACATHLEHLIFNKKCFLRFNGRECISPTLFNFQNLAVFWTLNLKHSITFWSFRHTQTHAHTHHPNIAYERGRENTVKIKRGWGHFPICSGVLSELITNSSHIIFCCWLIVTEMEDRGDNPVPNKTRGTLKSMSVIHYHLYFWVMFALYQLFISFTHVYKLSLTHTP